MTPKEILAMCRQKDIKAVDLRFTDFFGKMLHFTIPVSRLTEDSFEDGFGFDGSNVRGWQSIHESDMLAVPQVGTEYVDPFAELPTLSILCNIQDPITGEEYTRDPRNVARKAANYLIRTGVADQAVFGPEPEFFVFDNVRFEQRAHEAFYHVDSNEGQWNRGLGTNVSGHGPNLGYHLRHSQGYCPAPPGDQLMDLRNEMMQRLIDCGIDVEGQHHEAGTAGQAEVDLSCDHLVAAADAMTTYKYVIKNVARQHGKTVTFMPKPIYGDNGSGMHTHLSLWKDDQPLFAGSQYGGLSEMALHAIGGILKHARALLAITNPTTNSYKRLVPGFEAPVNLVYSQRNRSAACRIPVFGSDPRRMRIEFRCPDPSSNPYLAFSAMLMAALDGIQNNIHPGDPVDENIYEIKDREFPVTPRSLSEALDALEADHEFLLQGDVFTSDVIQNWLDYKRCTEVEAMRLRPHPYEFCLYFDA